MDRGSELELREGGQPWEQPLASICRSLKGRELMQTLGESRGSQRSGLFLKSPLCMQAVHDGSHDVCPPGLHSSCWGSKEESSWEGAVRSEARGCPTSYSDSGGPCVALIISQQGPRKWKVSGFRVAGACSRLGSREELGTWLSEGQRDGLWPWHPHSLSP